MDLPQKPRRVPASYGIILLSQYFGQHFNALTASIMSVTYYVLARCEALCGRDSLEPVLPALLRTAGQWSLCLIRDKGVSAQRSKAESGSQLEGK